METEPNLSGDYFDTPARAERLQLLLHLVRNAGEVLYLRAPSGGGKTRFAHQLLDILGDEMATVWVRAEKDTDVPSVAVDQLGLAQTDASPWPDAVMAGLTGQDLLLIVDEADRLGLEAVESLALLHARGGRLLLVGRGGLAQTNGNWDVQFVDLPAFDAVQTVAFLRTQAGEHAARVTDDLAAGLHRAANGLPGPLLDALNGVLGTAVRTRRVQRAAVPETEGPRRPLWPWAFGGLLLILLLSVLLFQDQINALFSPSGGAGMAAPVVINEAPPAPNSAEDLRAEAVSALMPEIRLPELNAGSGESSIGEMATAAGPASKPAGGEADRPIEAAPKPESLTGADRIDPLDAVMQDALAAAEAGRQPESPSEEAVAVADPVQVEKKPVETAPMKPAAPVVPESRRTAETVASSVVESTQATPPPMQAPELQPAVVQKPVAPEPVLPEPVVPEQVTESPRVAPAPAPVESRQAAPSKAKPSVAVATVVSVTAPVQGSAWLKNRPADRYTLQLVGARDRGAVQKFVRDFGIEAPYAIFERDLKGKPWYSLVAGDYADREAAIAARGRLPKRLERSGVWPRTFGSIQKP